MRFRDALSNFYAIIVIFCTKALAPIQEKGIHLYIQTHATPHSHSITGIKRFAKSAWKTFKGDFGLLEENLSAAKDDVNEEIRLASEQEAYHGRELQRIEFKANRIHRSRHLAEMQESQLHRSTQLAEANDNQSFREQQMIALAEAKELRVQKAVREEGNLRIILS